MDFFRKATIYPVTFLTIALSVVLSLAAWRGGFARFVITPDALGREPWRLLTSVLVHVNGIHLLFNAMWLWQFGQRVEYVWGTWRTAGLFALLGVVPSLAEYAFVSGGVGLSGVLYGLFGMLMTLDRRDPRFRGVLDSRTTTLLVVWFFVCIVLTLKDVWKVANVAHGVGWLLGWCLGRWIAARRWEPRVFPPATLAIAALAVVLAAPWLDLRSEVNWYDLRYRRTVARFEAAAREDDWAEAAQVMRELARERPDEWRFHYNLALAEWWSGQHAAAAAAIERARELAPAEPAVAELARRIATGEVEPAPSSAPKDDAGR